jgi:Icc-related predicted phosphoesterase
MRLLLTAELMSNHRWFKWLDEGSKDYDLVAIAGDFISVFLPEPLNVQILKAKAFLRSLARKTRVVISSGNNDTVDEVDSSSRGPVPMWMAALDSINTLVSDGRTSVIRQQLIVTTLSYISTIDRKRLWLTEGAELRKRTNLPWLVIHHHPPAFHGSAGAEELSAGKLLEEFEPTLWLAGRFFDHAHPRGFSWIRTVDQSVVFNISQRSIAPVFREAAFPNHIVFDLESGKIRWNSWLESENEERVLELC